MAARNLRHFRDLMAQIKRRRHFQLYPVTSSSLLILADFNCSFEIFLCESCCICELLSLFSMALLFEGRLFEGDFSPPVRRWLALTTRIEVPMGGEERCR